MKRLNELTGKPFKLGDERGDGYSFYKYTKKLKKDGTFSEQWLKTEILKANLERNKIKRRKVKEVV